MDFHLSFYTGYIASKNPGAMMLVVANDKGYEPMLKHARAMGFAVRGLVYGKAKSVVKKAATEKVAAKKAQAKKAAKAKAPVPPAAKNAPAKTVPAPKRAASKAIVPVAGAALRLR